MNLVDELHSIAAALHGRFEQQVAARLAELRALMELTAHLHGASSADE